MRGFYVGTLQTVNFAVSRRGIQLGSYDHIKNGVIRLGFFQEGPTVQFLSAVIAGFATAFVSAPIDVVRTRLMTYKNAKTQTSAIDCCK